MVPQPNQQPEFRPDQVPVNNLEDLVKVAPPLNDVNTNIAPIAKSIVSPGFKSASMGWKFNSNGGPLESNGSSVVSTHFTAFFKAKTITMYVSDGTTPNGNLSGNTGDVCFGADSGKAYKCTSAGTTWVSFT